MKPKTQKQALIIELSKNWIGPIEAFNLVGSMKLSQRCIELGQLFTIEKRRKTKQNRFGHHFTYTEYRIIKDEFYKAAKDYYFQK
jgi:hypothetical protein